MKKNVHGCLLAAVLLFARVVFANPADLDPAFGTGGKVWLDHSTESRQATSMAVQADGKLIVVTSASAWELSGNQVLRFNADGSLDTSYGIEGIAADFTNDTTTAVRMAGSNAVLTAYGLYLLDSATKQQYQDTFLVRYDSTGHLDTTFGTGGRTASFDATGAIGGAQQFKGVAVAPDGKLVAVGSANAGNGNTKLLVARFNADGTTDTTFGTGGWYAFDTTDGAGNQELRDALVLSDGSIMAVGFAGPNHNAVLVSISATGGSNTLRFNGATQAECNAIALATSVRFVIACGSTGAPRVAGLVGFALSGAVDTGFSNNVSTSVSEWVGLSVASDGKLYAVGTNIAGHLQVGAFLSSGAPDTTFAGTGQYAMPESDATTGTAVVASGTQVVATGRRTLPSDTDIPLLVLDRGTGNRVSIAYAKGSSDTTLGGVRLQGDGRIVLGGTAPAMSNATFITARLNGDGSLDTSYGFGGYSSLTVPGMGSLVGVRDMELQPDGNVLVTGDFGGLTAGKLRVGVARLAPGGGGDAAFNGKGTPGYSYVELGSATVAAFTRSVRLQSDGKIVVVGTGINGSSRQAAVVRFNADGSVDTTFGTNGVALGTFASSTVARAMDLGADGTLVVTANVAGAIGVARFTGQGAVDARFGNAGTATFPMPAGYTLVVPTRIISLSNGKLLVVATVDSSTGAGAMVVRLNRDGTLDTSYAAGHGWTYIETSNTAGANFTNFYQAALSTNGKLVLVGISSNVSTNYHSVLLRLNADGTVDSTFGNGGIGTYSDALTVELDSAVVAPNGAIVMAGEGGAGALRVGLVAKTVADGSATGVLADPSLGAFGTQSIQTTSLPLNVTLSNEGENAVSISSITTSAPFSVTHNCSTLAPKTSCAVTLLFSPTVEGAVSGTLTIATTTGTQTMALSGTGQKSLVSNYYETILRRNPDQGGADFWNSEVTRITGLGGSVNEVWYAMAMSFFTSAEYTSLNRDDAGFVTDLYKAFFGRAPDASGLSYWTGQLAAGMPREVLLAQFMFSSEFGTFTTGIFGNTSARAEITMVMDFYRGLLGRLPDSGGLAYWVQQFQNAQCAGSAAVSAQSDSISSAFLNGAEYAARNRTNRQYVGDLYNAFMRRGADLSGVQFWIGQLDSGAMTREQLRQTFLNSPEFQARVSAVVNAGCVASTKIAQATLSGSVRVLTAAESGQIASVTGATVTFNGAIDLAPGTVFIANGSAYQVVSSASVNGQTVVSVQAPPIEAVFDSVHITGTYAVTPAAAKDAGTAVSSNQVSFPLAISQGAISGTGILTNAMSVDVDYQFDKSLGGLQSGHITVSETASASLTAQLSKGVTVDTDVPLKTFYIPIPLTVTDSLLNVIGVNLAGVNIPVSLALHASVGVQTQVTYTASVTGTISSAYTAGAGASSSGSIDGTLSVTPISTTTTGDPVGAVENADAYAYLRVRPALAVLNTVALLGADAKAGPDISEQALVVAAVPPYCAQLQAGLHGEISGFFKTIGFERTSTPFTKDWFPISFKNIGSCVKLSISPATQALFIGDTFQFTASALDVSGNPAPLPTSTQWSSSNVNVATVTNTGVANAVWAGIANITITDTGSGASASAVVNVTYKCGGSYTRPVNSTLNIVASDMPVSGDGWALISGPLAGSMGPSGISVRVVSGPVTYARTSGGVPVCKVTITGV